MNEHVTIERMTYGPNAIGHLPNGKAVFVSNAAPQDVLEIEITEEKSSFARARIVRIINPSPLRVEHASAADLSGIAPWQHLSYPVQLSAKRDNIVAALSHTAGFDAVQAEELVADCKPSKREWGYRNKLELNARTDAAGRFQLGFCEEGQDSVVDADSCLLAHKAICKAPKALRGAIRYAQGNQDLGIFRVGLRHSLRTGELEVALWTKPGQFPRAVFAKTLGQACKATGIVRVLAEPGKTRKIKGIEILDGQARWHDKLKDAQMAVSAPSFFQVNTAQAERMIEAVMAALGDDLDGAFVADLYAGCGTFSIPLAQAGADVAAIESAGSAVRDLRVNADDNNVDICIIGGDAARELPELGQLDALVVDPPYAGLAESVPKSIADARPSRLVYVSCNPSTWARDVMRLQNNKMALRSVQPIDLFPQTYHVELVSVFEPV